MPETKRNKKLNNKTRRVKVKDTVEKKMMAQTNALVKKKFNKDCPIGLKSFEEQFSKTMINKKKGSIKTNEDLNKQLVKELMTTFSPSNIKPNSDFYSYINYLWLKNAGKERQAAFITQVDDFRLVQAKVFDNLDKIIQNYYKTHNNELAKNLKNFYQSLVKMNSKSDTRRLAKEAVEMVKNMAADKNNMWKMLAYINKNEMIAHLAPFVWSLNPDDKDSKVFRCYINPHHFTMVDINVYFDDGKDVEYKKRYRNAFTKINQEIFDTLLGPNEFNAQDVFDVELEIFDALGCVDVKTGDEESYNKVYADEAMTKYGFDWHEFSKELGFPKTPSFFITSSLNYLKCGTDLLREKWNTPKWQTYWTWIILRILTRITTEWEVILYKFAGNFERGQEESVGQKDSFGPSSYLSVPFNTFLTEQYVKHYENPQAVEFVRILANDLKAVFMRIIGRNTWMSPSTRKYALKKLEHLKFTIAKPEKLRPDPLLGYTDNLYDNLQKIYSWRHKEFIKLEGKPVIDIPYLDFSQFPVKMSGTQAYIVNASYTPSKNGVYMNLGYIQKPFVDLDERGIEYNLAHVGFTIAHELGHVLDDWGSKYDENGNLHDWWTPEDKKKFKEIQKDVIRQYEEFAKRDGIEFDASIGIGENIGDISALSICNEYLRDFQEVNHDLTPIRFLSFRVFYTYFAYQQRQIVKKKALSAQLKTNPHPLNKYRTNVPLSRSVAFRAVYNVKKGDEMWWHNTNQVW